MMMWFNCREVTRVMQSPAGAAPGLYARVAIALHRLICAPCRYYKRQVDAMSATAARLADAPGEAAGSVRLDDDAKARIRARLRAAAGKDG